MHTDPCRSAVHKIFLRNDIEYVSCASSIFDKKFIEGKEKNGKLRVEFVGILYAINNSHGKEICRREITKWQQQQHQKLPIKRSGTAFHMYNKIHAHRAHTQANPHCQSLIGPMGPSPEVDQNRQNKCGRNETKIYVKCFDESSCGSAKCA